MKGDQKPLLCSWRTASNTLNHQLKQLLMNIVMTQLKPIVTWLHILLRHLAWGIFMMRLKKIPPSGTFIPSVQWLRYQLWPRKPTAPTSKRYKGDQEKFMVQSRQFRYSGTPTLIHIMPQHCSSIKACLRFVTTNFTTLICQDDKHTMKVGKPGYLVVAVDHGKAVLVGLNEKLIFGDHDFNQFSITPSVNFKVNIPETIEESFYHGKVFVSLKDANFLQSSPIQHACELRNILCSSDVQPTFLL